MPLSSMTGFGQAERNTPSGNYHIELRSVNNRFLDIQMHVPRSFSSIEYRIKKYLSSKISRGSIFLNIILNRDDDNGRFTCNKSAANSYIHILHTLCKEYNLKDDITLSHLLSFNDLIKKESIDQNEDTLWKHIKPIIDAAMQDFISSRQKEARYIISDLKKIISTIGRTIDLIEKRAPARLKHFIVEINKKVNKIIDKKSVDQSRIALEISIMADKLDIAEECTRFRAHLQKMTEDFAGNGPIGKKLGFLLQEMNREANTIASKANDTKISHYSVILKENIEKIREQILNIE